MKNNIATNDKMNTTGEFNSSYMLWSHSSLHIYLAGSWLLLGAKVSRDATTVRKLREAGAIILGKANLSQWAQSRSSDPVRGWSAHGGQTYAAYYEKQDPGGSSSGSGVASDLGLALATLGTETDGSIIFPSHKNGIVGIKPTVGLTSRHMVIPLTEHQDTVGPMARTVRDAARILQVIAGYDPRDNYTSAIPDIPDYVAACDADALRGARIGVPWNIVQGDISSYMPQEEVDAYKAVLANLTDAGAILVTANFSKGREANETAWRRIVASSDLVTNLGDYVKQLTYNPYNLTSLADIRDETQKHPLEEYPARDTGVFDHFLELGFRNDDPRVWPAYQNLQHLRGKHGMFGAMDEHDLDALVMPSGVSSSWAAVIGAPVVTVPLGYWPADAKVSKDETGQLIAHAPGVPMGLSFMGKKWSEEKLIGYAYAFEQRSRVRERSVKRWIQPRAEVCDFAECAGNKDGDEGVFGVGFVVSWASRVLVEWW